MAYKKPKKKGRVSIAVPEFKEEYYTQLFYTIVYQDDPDDKLIYETIKNNPDLTANEIKNKLIRDHKIARMASRIKNFAKRIGIKIKE